MSVYHFLKQENEINTTFPVPTILIGSSPAVPDLTHSSIVVHYGYCRSVFFISLFISTIFALIFIAFSTIFVSYRV